MKKEIIGHGNNNIKQEKINIKYKDENVNELLYNKLIRKQIDETAVLNEMTTDRKQENLENEEMKKEIIGQENNNIKQEKINIKYKDDNVNADKKEFLFSKIDLEPIDETDIIYEATTDIIHEDIKYQGTQLEKAELNCIKKKEDHPKTSNKESSNNGVTGFLKSIGNSIKGLFNKKNSNSDTNIKEYVKNKNEEKNEIKDEIKNENKELDIKDIINEQNFVEGYWEINEKTKKIKEKYKNEFKLLKKLKNKNINDNIAITILIIYFINKEHSELLNELLKKQKISLGMVLKILMKI